MPYCPNSRIVDSNESLKMFDGSWRVVRSMPYQIESMNWSASVTLQTLSEDFFRRLRLVEMPGNGKHSRCFVAVTRTPLDGVSYSTDK
jgi:hypothetical protein